MKKIIVLLLFVCTTMSYAGYKYISKWQTDGINIYRTSGNIGIGTTNPGVRLDIVTGQATNSAFHLGEASDEGLWYTVTADDVINLSGGVEYVSGSWVARATEASIISSVDGKLKFWGNTSLTPGSSFSPTELMRIQSTGGLSLGNGYVTNDPGAGKIIVENGLGIGTNSPTATFHVVGTSSFTSTAYFGDTITANGKIRTVISEWWYCKYVDMFTVSPGGSGATLIVPTANTLGGYGLDVNTEYLYITAKICSNWDASSDIEIKVFWESNTTGAINDTVDIQALVYMKGTSGAVGETVLKTQTLEEALILTSGTTQYALHMTGFTIDYDDGSSPVDSNDQISIRLNLETDTSEVDDIVVHHAVIRYKTKQVQVEVN